MIDVESRPQRMVALQWQGSGGQELGVVPYRHGQETRYGIHLPDGLVRVRSGDWIVTTPAGKQLRVLGNAEFHRLYRVIDDLEGIEA